MKAVGIRELKNRLSEYLRLVRGGEAVLVTDRGAVVAELRPPGRTPLPGASPILESLIRRGNLTIGGQNQPDLYPHLAPIVPAGTSGNLLDEERADR